MNRPKRVYTPEQLARKKILDAEYRAKNKERVAANKKAYAEANKEKLAAYRAKYYQENLERIKAEHLARRLTKIEEKREYDRKRRMEKADLLKQQWAAWRAANKEHVKARMAANSARHHKENPDLSRIKAQNRRAQMRENGGKLSRGLAQKLLALQGGKCACCQISFTDISYELDHIIPIALGGTNSDENIQLLCQPCNRAKSAKHPVDFMQSKGFLL